MAGDGRPPTTLLLATSKNVGGRPEPALGRLTRGPAMTRRLRRDHLEDLFPDGHLVSRRGIIAPNRGTIRTLAGMTGRRWANDSAIPRRILNRPERLSSATRACSHRY